MDWAKATARGDEKQVLVFGASYIRGLTVQSHIRGANELISTVYVVSVSCECS